MKRKTIISLGAALCVLVLISGLYFYIQSKTPSSLDEQARYAAEIGGDYLVRHQHVNGMYDYRYDVESDQILSGYNMLRHAGTTYSLLELYGVAGGSSYRKAAELGLTYLQGKVAACPPPRKALLCVYDGERVKLGGNALAILALVEHARVTGHDNALTLAQALGDWMLAIQNEAGEYAVHIQDRDGRIDDHVSEYYPGEAIFALMRLHKETGEEKWLVSAQQAADWLIQIRDRGKTKQDIAHDHWLMYGLRELYHASSSKTYVEHAKKIVDSIADAQHLAHVPLEWVGGYYDPPRSTPTATRSEGLAAAYELFTTAGESEYATKAFEVLERGATFQLRTFIDGTTARKYPAPMRALGGFRSSLSSTEVRIDYVQHNISALLAYEAIVATQEK